MRLSVHDDLATAKPSAGFQRCPLEAELPVLSIALGEKKQLGLKWRYGTI
jgi:hypothetical protein